MRDEIERLLSKDGWSEDDVEDLRVIFEDEEGILKKASPDVLETALKILFRGKGSLRKRLKTASLMTGIPVDFLEKMSRFENPKSGRETEGSFPDLLEKALGMDPRCPDDGSIEDLRVACSVSSSFRDSFFSSDVHPYLKRVVSSKKTIPLVVDGSNLLWKGNLSVSVLDELLVALSGLKVAYYPVFYVFDANVVYVVPRSERENLEGWLSLRCSYLHSPADELIISMARSKKAHAMSDDRFRDHDVTGITVVKFPL